MAICAAICHNLLRAAGTQASANHAVARGATLRRRIVNVPARLARPQRRCVLHLPAHWPWADHWIELWHNVFPNRAWTASRRMTADCSPRSATGESRDV